METDDYFEDPDCHSKEVGFRNSALVDWAQTERNAFGQKYYETWSKFSKNIFKILDFWVNSIPMNLIVSCFEQGINVRFEFANKS